MSLDNPSAAQSAGREALATGQPSAPERPQVRQSHGKYSQTLQLTPEQEAIIKTIWGGPPKTRGELMALRAQWLPKLRPLEAKQAYHYALRRGWVTPTLDARRWTTEEDALLERYSHLSVSALARCFKRHGFSRSQTALMRRRQELLGGAVQARADNGYYSGQQAGELLGMSGKMISYVIRAGHLKATHSDLNTLTGPMWRITAKDLRAFALEHARYLDLSKVDKYAFLDLLFPHYGSRAGGGE